MIKESETENQQRDAQESATTGRTAAIVMAVVGVFVTFIPITAVSAGLATIARETGAGTAELQWVTDAYVIPMAAAVLSAGVVGDLYGRRRVFLSGLALTVIGELIAATAVLWGAAAVIPALLVGQAVAGLGAGLLLPTTLALIAHVVPDPRARGTYVGIWASGLVAGLAVGPYLGATVLAAFSWSFLWVPTMAFATALFVVAARFLPESKNPDGRHADWRGQVAGTIAIAGTIFGVIEGGARGWTSATTLIGLGAGLLGLVAFILIERRSTAPLMDLQLFRTPAFVAAAAAALLAMFAIVGIVFLLSVFLGQMHHLGPIEVANRLIFINGVALIVSPFVGRLMAHVRPLVLLAIGTCGGSVGASLLATIHDVDDFGGIAWRLAILGVSLSLMMTSASVTAINAVPWRKAGMAAATSTALRQTGGALGPAVLGAVFLGAMQGGADPIDGFRTALLVSAGLMAAAGVLCVVTAIAGRPRAGAVEA